MVVEKFVSGLVSHMKRVLRKKMILWRGESVIGTNSSPSFVPYDVPPNFAPQALATGRSHLLILDCMN